MGKRVLFALGLLVCLVALGLWSHKWLEDFCQTQTALIARGQTEEAYAAWRRAEPWVACLVGHEELNQAGDCYAELRRTPEENQAPIRARLLYWLWALAEYDRPGLRSLL